MRRANYKQVMVYCPCFIGVRGADNSASRARIVRSPRDTLLTAVVLSAGGKLTAAQLIYARHSSRRLWQAAKFLGMPAYLGILIVLPSVRLLLHG